VAVRVLRASLPAARHRRAGRAGRGNIPLPAHTAINPDDTSDFDPSGQRLAFPLDTVDHRGAEAGTYVYLADTGARTLARVPGPAIPVTALPAVPGAFPAGSSDVVSARWATDGPGLWIVATDGLFFQLAYWTGHGPLHVLAPQGGLAYKFAVPGQQSPDRGPAGARKARTDYAARATGGSAQGRLWLIGVLVCGTGPLAKLGPLSSAS
jgi:hypothetical protein